jgi:hypothetical protein
MVLLGHAVQPAPPGASRKVPSSHVKQVVQPGWPHRKPGAQGVQLLCPLSEVKVPGAQREQLTVTSSKNLSEHQRAMFSNFHIVRRDTIGTTRIE